MGVQEVGLLRLCVHRHHLWFRSLSPKLLKAGGSISYHFVYPGLVLSCNHQLPSETVRWVRWNLDPASTCLFLLCGLLFAGCKQKERAKRGSLHIRNADALGLSVILFSSFPTTLRCPTHQDIMSCQHNAVNFII